MANLVQLVATGAPVAINFIKSYLASPVIGGTRVEGRSKIANAFSGPLKDGILIEAESYRETERADVSTQMILSVDGNKRYISDNIAVHPRTWNISGYIPAELYEISALFAPSLKKKKDKLQKLFRARELTWFKTRECDLVEVAIESIEFETRPSVGNKQPITIVLKEIVVLTVETQNVKSTPSRNSKGVSPVDSSPGVAPDNPDALAPIAEYTSSPTSFTANSTLSFGRDLPSLQNPWYLRSS